jgi:hypothetical protein
MVRRRFTVFTGIVAAVVLMATPALAHECFNASRSDTGNANAVNGQALVSYEELLGLLCPAGAALVETAVAETGFDTEGVLVNSNALMGGGAHHNGLKTTDGHDIDYLPEEVSAAIGQAFGVCFGG